MHPNGDLNLIDSIREQKLHANVEKRWNVAEIAKLDTMVPFPFLFMHSEMGPELDDTARANLREYLLRGGFLFAEDCVNGKGRSDHSGTTNFFRRMAEVDLPKITPGRQARTPAVPDRPHLPLLLSFQRRPSPTCKASSTACTASPSMAAWWRCSPRRTFIAAVANGATWFGREQQIKAFQMGVNIYLYAMTGAERAGRKAEGCGGLIFLTTAALLLWLKARRMTLKVGFGGPY